MSRKLQRSEGSIVVRELRSFYVTLPVAVSQQHVTAPAVVAEMIDQLFDVRHDPQESFFGVYVNGRNAVVGCERLFRGTANYCVVSPRDFIRTGIVLGAVAAVAAHNHPSGQTAPSGEDLLFTRRLAEATQIVGIELLDSIIIGFDDTGALRFSSMREREVIS